MNITLFDTSVATDNLGDEIIMDAVEQVVSEVLPNAYVFRIATHEHMSRISRRLLKKSSLCIVGGTNLLSAHMGPFALWKMMPWDVLIVSHAVLLGVGWRDYMRGPDPYTKWALNRILAQDYIHSVRDSYTLEKISGLHKRICNTACPTMWSLTASHCKSIPRRKADKAVTTLTYYRRSEVNDRQLLEMLLRNYSEVYFWAQQSDDQDYFVSLGITGIKHVPPSVSRYTEFLDGEDVDFIGTRLHGGIRAMQKRKRTLILAVDNRAREIARTSNLPVVDRDNVTAIEEWVYSDQPTTVTLPATEIAAWKSQF
jgi:polysaccharide pyruvyl transferase WcaK-like protein